MVRRLVVKILVSAVALWLADYLLVGFGVAGGIKGYLIAGLVLGLLNALVRPVIKLITFPLILLTLGLFTIVINGAMLVLTARVTGLVSAPSPLVILWATLIISGVHILLDPSTDTDN